MKRVLIGAVVALAMLGAGSATAHAAQSGSGCPSGYASVHFPDIGADGLTICVKTANLLGGGG